MVITRLASVQGRKDDLPNQELAREIAEKEDRESVAIIAEHLFHKDKNIQSDCIKVLYEIGYLKPVLIADYCSDFLKLLKVKNNRLIWGAMIALSTIALLKAEQIYEQIDVIYFAIEQGSVITIDSGIKVLATVASVKEEYAEALFPFLLEHLRNCRSKEVGQHAESILLAVNSSNRDRFIEALKSRESSLSSSQLARVKKIYKPLGNK